MLFALLLRTYVLGRMFCHKQAQSMLVLHIASVYRVMYVVA